MINNYILYEFKQSDRAATTTGTAPRFVFPVRMVRLVIATLVTVRMTMVSPVPTWTNANNSFQILFLAARSFVTTLEAVIGALALPDTNWKQKDTFAKPLTVQPGI